MVDLNSGNLICKRNDGEENHEEDNLSFIDQQNQSGSGALTEEGTRILKCH